MRHAALRDAYAEQARGLLAGGTDAFLIETLQDLLQAKAAVVGCKRALAEARDAADPRAGHRRDHRHVLLDRR